MNGDLPVDLLIIWYTEEKWEPTFSKIRNNINLRVTRTFNSINEVSYLGSWRVTCQLLSRKLRVGWMLIWMLLDNIHISYCHFLFLSVLDTFFAFLTIFTWWIFGIFIYEYIYIYYIYIHIILSMDSGLISSRYSLIDYFHIQYNCC